MEKIRQLLAAVAALTLLFSVISGANANYFAASSAFAEEGEDDEGQSASATFGTNSKVHLEIDDEIEDESDTGSVEADLRIETQDQDLADGSYAVTFGCENAGIDLTLDGSLSVYGGEGDFEAELSLLNGTTYDDCAVGIGEGLSVALPMFTVNVGAYEEEEEKDRGHGANSARDDEDDEEDDEEEDDAKVRGHERERESNLAVEGDDVEIKVKVNGLNMSDGTYDVTLSCDDPEINMTFESALLVEEGEGMFKAEVTLVNGTYIGCELSAGDTLLASFDSFRIDQTYTDEEIEEKRKEKRRDIVSQLDAREEHKRRMNAHPASTGDYEPGWNYTLVANGTAYQKAHDDEEADDVAEDTSTNSTEIEIPTNSTDTTTNSTDTTTDETDVIPEEIDGSVAEVDIDMAVWKSNKALILLNVLGGTVEVEGEIYNVEIGYALYSLHHDVMRIGAFVTDESGNVYKLKLRGYASGEDAEFPDAPGGTIELEFEGKGGPGRNALNSGWELSLEGTLTAV